MPGPLASLSRATPMSTRPYPLALLALAALSCGSSDALAPRLFSGGALSAEQAAYDVTSYKLELRVDPEERRIDGACSVRVEFLEELAALVLDLDPQLVVTRVLEGAQEREFERQHGQLRVDLGDTRAVGAELVLRVEYGGGPRVAPRPPWEGGFQWEETPAGEPWIATSNQMDGADLWWPCKDHPSDKPDEMWLEIEVPEGLTCITNGRNTGVETSAGWTRSSWHVSTPISNYCVALNIAPYVELTHDYQSVSGDALPITFWALPGSVEQARAILPEFAAHMRFFEERFGPYPFRADKYAVVETPHLGMEHQTAIAYGNDFAPNEWDYDWLHHHELSHEWFSNLVTAPDWNDFWIHEGFGTYTQNLWIEQTHGQEGLQRSMQAHLGRILNQRAVAPRESKHTGEMYFTSLEGRWGELQSDSDIYFKGAWFLHTLRWQIGDEAFFDALRRLCYPTPESERVTDGSHCHFATTDDFLALAEQASGMQLDALFELYLRQPELPVLEVEQDGSALSLRWSAPDGIDIDLAVPVEVAGEILRVEMAGGEGRVELPSAEALWELDPEQWLLCDS